MKFTSKKAIRALSILLSALLLVSAVSIPVSAGSVRNQISLVASDGSLNIADWYDPNDTLKTSGGALVIPNDSTEETRIISKYSALANTANEESVSINGKFKFTNLPAGKKFVIAFGVPSLESNIGDAGQLQIEFVNSGGITAGIVYINEDGVTKRVAANKSTGITLNTVAVISININSRKKLTMTVDGNAIFSNLSLPTNADGRVGLMQTGNCGALVSEFKAKFVTYELPENSNYFEDFENGTYNDNFFTIEHKRGYTKDVRSPNYVAVEKYNDNYVLMFRNTGTTYIGTKQNYSNFELTFDMPYFSRNSQTDEYGKTRVAPCTNWGISCGDQSVDMDINGTAYKDSAELTHFTATKAYSENSKPKLYDNILYPQLIGSSELTSDEGFSVRVRLVDGRYTVDMKRYTAKEYVNIIDVECTITRVGSIKIWTFNDANMAIDNIRITNLDKGGKVVDLDYKAATVPDQNYEYTPTEFEFAETDSILDKNSGFNWYLITAVTAGVAVLFVATCYVITVLRQKGIRFKINFKFKKRKTGDNG